MYSANLSFFTIIIALFLMCSTSVLSSPVKLSSSHPSTEFARLGPAPYAELQKRIAAFKAAQESEGLEARQLNTPLCRLTGLTWCEHTNFQGECFYGQFAGCLEHQPDSWWRDRISSVRPDDNVTCEFRSIRNEAQTFTQEGQNCRGYMNDQVLNFTCKLVTPLTG